jgi:membrane protein YdbS with pleckstrin-like domain
MDATFNFRGRRPNEEVVAVVKQHVWLLFPIVLAWAILLAVLLVILHFFMASGVSSVAVAVVIVAGGIYSIYKWFIWNNGLYIVTNQRVIKVDQRGLFNRLISEAEIERIQEISTDINGPIKTVLNFGTVKIQTASTTGQVDLWNVPHPYDIQQQIVALQRSQKDGPISSPAAAASAGSSPQVQD